MRTTASDYSNAKIGTVNVALEQELAPDWSLYVDYTWSKGIDLSQFLNINSAGRGAPFSPQLGDVFVHTNYAHSLYNGVTFAHPQALLARIPARGELRDLKETWTPIPASATRSPTEASTFRWTSWIGSMRRPTATAATSSTCSRTATCPSA